MALELGMGNVVRLKKAHPCGGFEWRVVRLGADVGLRCLQCDRRVMITRSVLEKRVRGVSQIAPKLP